MTHTYQIKGMTCNGCRATVEKSIASLPEVISVAVNLEEERATVAMKSPVQLEQIQKVLPAKFSVSRSTPAVQSTAVSDTPAPVKSKLQQLKPLFLILGYISVATILMHFRNVDTSAMMLDFMGLFYIVFSFFKMLDIKGFAQSFRMYDPLAKVVPAYANVYPFIETGLGLMFLFRFEIPVALVLTLIILGITTIGVSKTLLDKKSIQCACLGTALKLPMTEATFLENAIMILMAIVLLIKIVG